MSNFINHSIFPAIKFSARDQHGVDFEIVTARVSYDLIINNNDGVNIALSLEQAGVNYSDVHHRDPIKSSVKYESDLSPYKPKTDVIINATAFSPGDNEVPSFEVYLKIGEKIKSLRIHGPRKWYFTISGWVVGLSNPIRQLDVRYEYASGGGYEVNGKEIVSPNNPLGIGWYPKDFLKDCKYSELPAPQIESVDMPIKDITAFYIPEGMGFFGKGWRGRIENAGTFDDEWVRYRHPELPEDFNFKYWCGAHPSLQIAHPKPSSDIKVELGNLISSNELKSQKVNFYLPVESLFLFFATGSGIAVSKDMILDTIVIDMDIRKVYCTYRMALAEMLEISEIQLRYISVCDRKMQMDSAAKLKENPLSKKIIVLPPSLLRKG